MKPMDLVKKYNLRSYDNTSHDYIGWSPSGDYLGAPATGAYEENGKHKTWKDFQAEWGEEDVDCNLVADFYFDVSDDKKTLSLNIWMLHPRKGASKAVTVESVTEADIPAIKRYLKLSLELHMKHFQFVSGDNDKGTEASESNGGK